MNKRAFFLTVWVLLSAIAFGQNEKVGKPLYLKSGTRFLPRNIDQLESTDLGKHSVNGIAWIILQFKDIPQPHQVQKLEHKGIKLFSYLPKHSYLAQVVLPANSKALQLSGARAFYLLQVEDKTNLLSDSNGLSSFEGNEMIIEILLVDGMKSTAEKELISQGATLLESRMPNLLKFRIDGSKLSKILNLPYVTYLNESSIEYQSFNRENRQTQRVSALQSSTFGLNGNGVKIGVGDNNYIDNHIDLLGRNYSKILRSSLFAPSSPNHAIHVAGTIAGAGNENPIHKGMAPKAYIINDYFGAIVTTLPQLYLNHQVSISNNSWGSIYVSCSNYGNYSSSSVSIDKSLNDYNKVLHVFAAGNNGRESCNGVPNNYRNLANDYNVAKNVLTVGAVTHNDTITDFSSRGPARDGRLKPEIVATGADVTSCKLEYGYETTFGTSMAAPTVSGIAALLTQRYKQLNNKALPDAALLKAILCNTAKDMGNNGPDYQYGFGVANAYRAIEVMNSGNFYDNTISNGTTQNQTITVGSNVDQLKVMICWSDINGGSYNQFALTNDLDLEVIDPNNNVVLPWTLDHSISNVANTATRTRDSINNIEQVTISNPIQGTYTIRVKGTTVAMGSQKYFAVYDLVEKGITLTYPFGDEKWVPGETEFIRWDAWGTGNNTFKLEYSINSGNSWSTINAAIADSLRFYEYTVPSVATHQFRIRVSVNSTTYSDASNHNVVVLNQPTLTATALGSGAAFVAWNTISGANSYNILHFNDGKWNKIKNISTNKDTLKNLPIEEDVWLCIEPVFSNGIKARHSIAKVLDLSTGYCPWPRDIQITEIVSPAEYGRINTSDSMTANDTVVIKVKNVGNNDLDSFKIGFTHDFVNNKTETIRQTINKGQELTIKFTNTVDNSFTWQHDLSTWASAFGDTRTSNDTILNYTINHRDNWAMFLPYKEDFEFWEDTFYLGYNPSLNFRNEIDFLSSSTNGRLTVEQFGDLVVSGNKSIILDRNRSLSSFPSLQVLQYTLNMSNYKDSSVYLSFNYKTFSDGGSENDAVFVRGNDTAAWLSLYKITGGSSGNFKDAKDLNISKLLHSNNQEFTSSFQIRFSQHGSASTLNKQGNAGIAYDDIEIFLKSPDVKALSIESQKENSCYSSTETIALKLTNLSTSNLQNVPVSYRINGGQPITETINSINAFDTVTHFFSNTANFYSAGNYNIDAWVSLPADTSNNNDSIIGHEFFATENVTAYPYYQSFENNNGNWFTEGLVWQWGTSTNQNFKAASKGVKYWATGLNISYGINHTSFLVSPCFNLSNLGSSVVLAFRQKRELAQGDKFYIEYSEDGNTWNRLGTQGSGQNWYNNASNYWYGDTTEWHTSQIQIPIGSINDRSAVRFRFVIEADAADHAYGWQIDEVFVGELGNDIEIVSLENDKHKCGRSSAETISVTVKNNSGTQQNNIPVRYQIDGQNVVQESINSISAGSTVTYQFNTKANLSTPEIYNINSWVAHSGDNFALNDSLVNIKIYAHEQLSTTNFYEDFENDNGNWLVEGATENWEWGVPNYGDLTSAGQGSKSWVTGLNGGYVHNYEGFLYTGCFDLSAYTTTPHLSFQFFKELAPTTDHFYMEYSENQVDWIKLGQKGEGSNWYNDDNNYWNGREAIWKQAFIDFPLNTVNDSSKIQFRFVLKSDIRHTDDGIAIDSFILKELGKDVQTLAVLNPKNGENIALGATEQIKVVVKNNSNQTLQNIPVKYRANGGNLVSQSIAQLVAHQTDTLTFLTTADLSLIGLQTFTVYTDFQNDIDQSNDTLNIQFRNLQKITNFPYKADFESDQKFYSAGTLSSWERGTPADTRINAAAIGTKAWVTDLNNNHNQGEQSYLYTPAFDLSAMNGDAFVRFYFYRYLGTSSNVTLEYSDNNGASWTRLGSTNSSQNWYNSLNSWHGLNQGWLQTQHLIPTGSIASLDQVRFRFKLDASPHFTPNEGFAVDEFEVFELVDDVELIEIITPTANENLGQKTIQVRVANNMSSALSNIPVKYQLNNNNVVSQTINSIAGNDTVTLNFTTPINLNSLGTFNLKVWTDKATDTYTSNDTQQIDITVLNVVTSYPYYEGFESSNGNWQASGNLSTWEWGAPANTQIKNAAKGNNAWVTNLDGRTNRNEKSYLTSPLFNMSSISGNPILSFYHQFYTISLHKYYIEYTEDGNTWNKLGQNGSGTNWYNHTSHYWNNSNYGWQQSEYTIPLNTFNNKSNVRIRFVFENDAFNQVEGIAIDEIFIGHKGTDLELIIVTAPDTACGLSNSETVTIAVKNYSASATGAFNVSYQLNGGNVTTEQMSSISSGSTANFSFTSKANVSSTGDHTIKVWTNLGADDYNLNDTFHYEFVHAPTINSFPYNENFENNNGGWYGAGNQNVFEWATPSGTHLNSASSGSKAWVSNANGNIPNSTVFSLNSPCFDLSGFGTNPTLSFKMNRYLQWGNQAWVEYSEDGINWIKLGQNGSGLNWYNNSHYWNQNSSGYELCSYEVPVSGMTVKTAVKFRIVINSDQWTNAEGLAIDDVNIQSIANDVEALSFNMNSNGAGLGNETIKVSVKNNSSTAQSNVFVYYQLNNGVPVKDTIPLISANSTVNLNFTVKANLSATATHQLSFWTAHSNDNYNVNDTVSGFEITNLRYISSYPYFEDFETDNGTFYGTGTNSTWEHGVPSSSNTYIKRAASGTKAWVTNLDGDFGSQEVSYLYSPVFDLSSFSTNPYISISFIYEQEWDATFYLEYSEDGQTWNSMASANSGRNWNQWGFSNNKLHWHVASTEIPVSGMSSKDSVQFRVYFDATWAFLSYEGVGVDNFHIHEKAEMHDGSTVKNITSSATGNGWVHFSSNSKRVVSINPQGENLGNVSVTSYVHTGGVRNYNNQYLLDRSWVINPQNQPDNPVKVRLYMLDTEVDALRNASGCANCTGIDDAFKLAFTKYHGTNEDSLLTNNVSGTYQFFSSSNAKIVPYGKGYCVELTVSSFSEIFASGGGLDGNTALPVEFTSFNVQLVNNGHDALIEWQTAMEENNSHFEIERSFDGNIWEMVGTVAGQGTTFESTDYQFIDQLAASSLQPSAQIYYRLKQVDYDGAFDYSEIRTLNFKPETQNSFKVWPNPATTGKLYLSEIDNYIITNTMGKVVLQVEGANEIDITGLAKGTYLIIDSKGVSNLFVVN
ncbi:MAG: S8 family serine peptidase [Bacteroidia bacterium]